VERVSAIRFRFLTLLLMMLLHDRDRRNRGDRCCRRR
jgi:hypothetical protein